MAAGTGSPGRRPTDASAAALDFSARTRPHLFLRVLLAHLSDQRPDRPARHSARRELSGRRGKLLSRCCSVSGSRQRCSGSASGNHALMLISWLGLLASRGRRFSTSGRAAHWRSAWSVFSRSLLRRRISPATNPTACCWKPASSHCSLRRPDCGPAWAPRMRLRGSACFCCAGNGSASTSNPAWSSSPAATTPGVT